MLLIKVTFRSSFALLINDERCKPTGSDSDDVPPSDPEDNWAARRRKKLSPTVIDRLHLDLVQLPDTVPPNGCFASVSYERDMELFAQKHNANAFVDPFEEEERRSRTEMWVESTSPGYPSEGEREEAQGESPEESDGSIPIPEVKVVECSEKSVSASPPGNTTTSTTGVEEEPPPPQSIQIHVNNELIRRKKKGMDRMDSLATSEMSEANSLVSSEMDKASLVDLKEFDRFWLHLYTKTDPEEEARKKREDKKEARQEPLRRSRTPTIERVVLYYTTDRRLSLTPTVSSLSPSPEPTQYSAVSDSGRHLFIQTTKPAMVQQDSMSSEPIGDITVPVAPRSNSVKSKGRAGVVRPKSARPRRSAHERPLGCEHVIHESDEVEPRCSSSPLEKEEEDRECPEKDECVDDEELSELFFRLDEISGSDSEGGRVVVGGSEDAAKRGERSHFDFRYSLQQSIQRLAATTGWKPSGRSEVCC
ncbi:unnamed protein product [Heligmosomoides polygyrus]|uniref:NET domain-containing protein n=1 Tax=Heligmosomoides polygyrus TaxID=6339 RepID=A0A3P8FLY2_HELPZ|nr:unnamed protein product [Heligmosomoides polygyrus]